MLNFLQSHYRMFEMSFDKKNLFFVGKEVIQDDQTIICGRNDFVKHLFHNYTSRKIYWDSLFRGIVLTLHTRGHVISNQCFLQMLLF